MTNMNPIPIFINDILITNPDSMSASEDSFIQVEAIAIIDHSSMKVKKQFSKLVFRGNSVEEEIRSGFSIPARSTVIMTIEIVNPVFTQHVNKGFVQFELFGDKNKELASFQFSVTYEVLEGKLTLLPITAI